MTKHLQTITAALSLAIKGEAAPSFKTQEFADLVGAIKALTGPALIGEPCTRLVHEQIGLKALLLLLEHIGASMQSERALSMMRGNGEETC